MARARNNGRLDELAQAQTALVQAQALLTQNQAALVAQARETDARIAEIRARMAETDRVNAERFARIEALLIENNRMLERLPEAIREKIGFKTSER